MGSTEYSFRHCDQMLWSLMLFVSMITFATIMAMISGAWDSLLMFSIFYAFIIFILLNVCYVEYKDVDGVSFEISYKPLHIIMGKCTFKYEDISSIKIYQNDLISLKDACCGKKFKGIQIGIGKWPNKNFENHIAIWQGTLIFGCISCCNENKCPQCCNCRPYDPLNPKANGKVLQIEFKKNTKKQILPWTSNGCCFNRGIEYNGIIIEYYDYVRFKQFIENSKNIKIEDEVDLTVNGKQEGA